MSVSTTSPVPADDAEGGPGAGVLEDVEFERMRADAVLTGRAMSSGEYLAGLIAAGELESTGRPDRLPADLFVDVDPVVVQRVWERALAVGFVAGRTSVTPRLSGERLQALQEGLTAAGFHAMAGSVGRSRRLVAGVHPADGEIARERD